MSFLEQVRRRSVDLLGGFLPAAHRAAKRRADVLRAGRRSYTRRVEIRGRACVEKVFAPRREGRRVFRSERSAYLRFRHRPWMPTWIESGRLRYVREMYPDADRLDRLAPLLGKDERVDLACRALTIVLDLYAHGYAHRDFHVLNLYCVDGDLKLADFETLVPYPEPRAPFAESYDVTGEGLESPYKTRRMGFRARHESGLTLCQVLGVTFEEVMAAMPGHLKRLMREASATFRSGERRHTCRAQRIYAAFSLPGLRVEREEAQRDCARRFEQFGVRPPDLAGRRMIDLGCNLGGMLFEAQKFSPGPSLGVECDEEKLALARMVAAFCGVGSVRFLHGDIDRLSVRGVGGPFDVVFCLAVEKHVRSKRRLYRLLGALAKETVYFEGNSTTDPEAARRRLLGAGFRNVELLGTCDDDCLASNNNRPLLVARR